MRRRFLKLLAISTMATLPFGSHAQQLHEISFGLPSKSLVASPARIADELGLFAKHGLKPKFSYIDSTSATATALLSKSVDFSTTGISEVIAATARKQPLVVVANHYRGLAGSLVLAKSVVDRLGVKPDAPLPQRLKALDNVLLASVSKISSLTIAYKGAANASGAEPRLSYMSVGAMGAALESGAVEGIIVTAPFWAIQVLKGTGVLWLSPPRGDLPTEYMPTTAAVAATTRALAESDPALVGKVADVFDELSEAFTKRPAETKAAIARLFPDLDMKVLDLVFEMEAKSFSAKMLTPVDVAHDIKHMKLSGLDLGPIDSVEPASVLFKR